MAGFGTRFLPATKSTPKEMIPIVDRPLAQYVVDEAIEAGIETLIFIYGRNKKSIPDYFDRAFELEMELEQRGKIQVLERLKHLLPKNINCIFVRQSRACGLGDAVLQTKAAVGHEPFAVFLADDLLEPNEHSEIKSMIEVHREHGGSVIAVEEVADDQVSRYGIVEPRDQVNGDGPVTPIRSIIEKPTLAEAPSRLGVIGRYILTPDIFEHLEKTAIGRGNELQLTDAIERQIEAGSLVSAMKIRSRRHDCGHVLGYLQAQVELALKREDVGEDFQKYLRSLLL